MNQKVSQEKPLGGLSEETLSKLNQALIDSINELKANPLNLDAEMLGAARMYANSEHLTRMYQKKALPIIQEDPAYKSYLKDQKGVEVLAAEHVKSIVQMQQCALPEDEALAEGLSEAIGKSEVKKSLVANPITGSFMDTWQFNTVASNSVFQQIHSLKEKKLLEILPTVAKEFNQAVGTKIMDEKKVELSQTQIEELQRVGNQAPFYQHMYQHAQRDQPFYLSAKRLRDTLEEVINHKKQEAFEQESVSTEALSFFESFFQKHQQAFEQLFQEAQGLQLIKDNLQEHGVEKNISVLLALMNKCVSDLPSYQLFFRQMHQALSHDFKQNSQRVAEVFGTNKTTNAFEDFAALLSQSPNGFNDTLVQQKWENLLANQLQLNAFWNQSSYQMQAYDAKNGGAVAKALGEFLADQALVELKKSDGKILFSNVENAGLRVQGVNALKKYKMVSGNKEIQNESGNDLLQVLTGEKSRAYLASENNRIDVIKKQAPHFSEYVHQFVGPNQRDLFNKATQNFSNMSLVNQLSTDENLQHDDLIEQTRKSLTEDAPTRVCQQMITSKLGIESGSDKIEDNLRQEIIEQMNASSIKDLMVDQSELFRECLIQLKNTSFFVKHMPLMQDFLGHWYEFLTHQSKLMKDQNKALDTCFGGLASKGGELLTEEDNEQKALISISADLAHKISEIKQINQSQIALHAEHAKVLGTLKNKLMTVSQLVDPEALWQNIHANSALSVAYLDGLKKTQKALRGDVKKALNESKTYSFNIKSTPAHKNMSRALGISEAQLRFEMEAGYHQAVKITLSEASNRWNKRLLEQSDESKTIISSQGVSNQNRLVSKASRCCVKMHEILKRGSGKDEALMVQQMNLPASSALLWQEGAGTLNINGEDWVRLVQDQMIINNVLKNNKLSKVIDKQIKLKTSVDKEQADDEELLGVQLINDLIQTSFTHKLVANQYLGVNVLNAQQAIRGLTQASSLVGEKTTRWVQKSDLSVVLTKEQQTQSNENALDKKAKKEGLQKNSFNEYMQQTFEQKVKDKEESFSQTTDFYIIKNVANYLNKPLNENLFVKIQESPQLRELGLMDPTQAKLAAISESLAILDPYDEKTIDYLKRRKVSALIETVKNAKLIDFHGMSISQKSKATYEFMLGIGLTVEQLKNESVNMVEHLNQFLINYTNKLNQNHQDKTWLRLLGFDENQTPTSAQCLNQIIQVHLAPYIKKINQTYEEPQASEQIIGVIDSLMTQQISKPVPVYRKEIGGYQGELAKNISQVPSLMSLPLAILSKNNEVSQLQESLGQAPRGTIAQRNQYQKLLNQTQVCLDQQIKMFDQLRLKKVQTYQQIRTDFKDQNFWANFNQKFNYTSHQFQESWDKWVDSYCVDNLFLEDLTASRSRYNTRLSAYPLKLNVAYEMKNGSNGLVIKETQEQLVNAFIENRELNNLLSADNKELGQLIKKMQNQALGNQESKKVNTIYSILADCGFAKMQLKQLDPAISALYTKIKDIDQYDLSKETLLAMHEHQSVLDKLSGMMPKALLNHLVSQPEALSQLQSLLVPASNTLSSATGPEGSGNQNQAFMQWLIEQEKSMQLSATDVAQMKKLLEIPALGASLLGQLKKVSANATRMQVPLISALDEQSLTEALIQQQASSRQNLDLVQKAKRVLAFFGSDIINVVSNEKFQSAQTYWNSFINDPQMAPNFIYVIERIKVLSDPKHPINLAEKIEAKLKDDNLWGIKEQALAEGIFGVLDKKMNVLKDAEPLVMQYTKGLIAENAWDQLINEFVKNNPTSVYASVQGVQNSLRGESFSYPSDEAFKAVNHINYVMSQLGASEPEQLRQNLDAEHHDYIEPVAQFVKKINTVGLAMLDQLDKPLQEQLASQLGPVDPNFIPDPFVQALKSLGVSETLSLEQRIELLSIANDPQLVRALRGPLDQMGIGALIKQAVKNPKQLQSLLLTESSEKVSLLQQIMGTRLQGVSSQEQTREVVVQLMQEQLSKSMQVLRQNFQEPISATMKIRGAMSTVMSDSSFDFSDLSVLQSEGVEKKVLDELKKESINHLLSVAQSNFNQISNILTKKGIRTDSQWLEMIEKPLSRAFENQEPSTEPSQGLEKNTNEQPSSPPAADQLSEFKDLLKFQASELGSGQNPFVWNQLEKIAPCKELRWLNYKPEEQSISNIPAVALLQLKQLDEFYQSQATTGAKVKKALYDDFFNKLAKSLLNAYLTPALNQNEAQQQAQKQLGGWLEQLTPEFKEAAKQFAAHQFKNAQLAHGVKKEELDKDFQRQWSRLKEQASQSLAKNFIDAYMDFENSPLTIQTDKGRVPLMFVEQEQEAFKNFMENFNDFMQRSDENGFCQINDSAGFAALERKINEWHYRMNFEKIKTNNESWEKFTGDVVFDNIHAVELNSALALLEEGQKMHHCVSSYTDDCRAGKKQIYSIGYANQKVATLELRYSVEGKSVGQDQIKKFGQLVEKNPQLSSSVKKIVQDTIAVADEYQRAKKAGVLTEEQKKAPKYSALSIDNSATEELLLNFILDKANILKKDSSFLDEIIALQAAVENSASQDEITEAADKPVAKAKVKPAPALPVQSSLVEGSESKTLLSPSLILNSRSLLARVVDDLFEAKVPVVEVSNVQYKGAHNASITDINFINAAALTVNFAQTKIQERLKQNIQEQKEQVHFTLKLLIEKHRNKLVQGMRENSSIKLSDKETLGM